MLSSCLFSWLQGIPAAARISGYILGGGGTGNIPAHFGVRTQRYKLIYYYGLAMPGWELFDLKKDPEEMNNVYDEPAYTNAVKELKTELIRLRKELDENDGIVFT